MITAAWRESRYLNGNSVLHAQIYLKDIYVHLSKQTNVKNCTDAQKVIIGKQFFIVLIK